MNIKSFFSKWYETYAFSVTKDIMDKRVLYSGNLPWHIFTWGEVDAVEGAEALNTLYSMEFDEVITFSGYPNNFTEIKKIKSKLELEKILENNNDVYITASDFSWTFVKTHEIYLGPYFKFRELNY